MKINNKEFLNPQQQLYQNTKDIAYLKEEFKGEVYALKPYLEWPEDVVLERVEDPRNFTYVPREITNVPADAKYGYLLFNIEDEDGGAFLYKIKSVNNSTVYIEFYANVASHVPGPQGETGPQGPQGPQGATGSTGATGPRGYSMLSSTANLDTRPGYYTIIASSNLPSGARANDFVIGANGILGQIESVIPTNPMGYNVLTKMSIVGPQGTATIGIQVVAELPASGTEGVIYLVPAEDAETSNAYDEYIYINNAWEKFGYVNIDLTDYALKSELPTYSITSVPTETVGQDTYVDGIQVKNGTNNVTYNVYATNANPTLDGTEGELTSIRIGGTDYKVGGGKQLYQHHITVYGNSTPMNSFVKLVIINASSTLFTYTSLYEYLKLKGFLTNSGGGVPDDLGKTYSATGRHIYSPLSTTIGNVNSVAAANTQNALIIVSNSQAIETNISTYTVEDIVIPL